MWNRKNPRKSSTFEQFSKQNLLFEQLFCKKWKFGQNWSNLMKSLSPEHFHFFVFFKFLHFHTAVVDLWWPDSTKNTIFSSTKNALNPLEIKVNKNTKFCKKFHLDKNAPENCVDSHIFCWIWSFWNRVLTAKLIFGLNQKSKTPISKESRNNIFWKIIRKK